MERPRLLAPRSIHAGGNKRPLQELLRCGWSVQGCVNTHIICKVKNSRFGVSCRKILLSILIHPHSRTPTPPVLDISVCQYIFPLLQEGKFVSYIRYHLPIITF